MKPYVYYELTCYILRWITLIWKLFENPIIFGIWTPTLCNIMLDFIHKAIPTIGYIKFLQNNEYSLWWDCPDFASRSLMGAGLERHI
jgi:hypothetical protein